MLIYDLFSIFSIFFFHIRWPCMLLIYTPVCKFAQNFDAMLIYDLFSILLFHIRWPCMHIIYTPGCKCAQNFDAMLIYDLFSIFSIFFFHIRWPCMLLIYTPVCKFAQNFDTMSILWLLSIPFLFRVRWPCMHLIYTPVCKFAQTFDAMYIYDLFLSFCFIYGDHACNSSILQGVSLLKILMQCWLLSIPLLHIRWPCMHLIYTPGSKFAQNFDAVLTSFYPFVTYTVTMHACHL